jgi:hypothetical protein
LNPALASDLVMTINGADITATVPYGTNVSALVATFTTTGQGVTVSGAPQVSGSTSNDFTNPVTYTVQAVDGTTQNYYVTITIASGAHKDLTSFAFLASENPTLASDVVVTIGGSMPTVVVPAETDVTALVATFTTTGRSVTVGGVTQVSDTTPNDFTNAVTYTVHALDGTTQDYVFTVIRLAELQVTFAGNALGQVLVFDPDSSSTTCNASCTVPLQINDRITIAAATSSTLVGISGACSDSATSPGNCTFFAPQGVSKITVTFTTDPKEQWTYFTQYPVISVAHDPSGNVIAASGNGLTKLSGTGTLVWSKTLPVNGMATGPSDTIYVVTAGHVAKLDASGNVLWTAALDANSNTDCGNGVFPDCIAVGADGAVAVQSYALEGNGLARWDSAGNLSWSIAFGTTFSSYATVAIDAQGIVYAAVNTAPNIGGAVELRRFQPVGTELLAWSLGAADVGFSQLAIDADSGAEFSCTSSNHDVLFRIKSDGTLDYTRDVLGVGQTSGGGSLWYLNGVTANSLGNIAWWYMNAGEADPSNAVVSYSISVSSDGGASVWSLQRPLVTVPKLPNGVDFYRAGTIPVDAAYHGSQLVLAGHFVAADSTAPIGWVQAFTP